MRKIILTLSLGAVAGVASASFITLEFEGLSGSGVTNIGNNVIVSGYKFVSSGSAGFDAIDKDAQDFGNGVSDTIAANDPSATITVSRNDGGTFSIGTISLGGITNLATGGSVLFTGNLFGGGTVQQTFNWSGFSPMMTFNFNASFTDLVSLTFAQGDGETAFQFDNMRMAELQPVPEPFTMALGGAAAAAFIRKRRAAKKA